MPERANSMDDWYFINKIDLAHFFHGQFNFCNNIDGVPPIVNRLMRGFSRGCGDYKIVIVIGKSKRVSDLTCVVCS